MDTLEEAPGVIVPAQLSPGMMGESKFQDVTSPNDPIFWLHKAQLDRLWHLWQKSRISNGMDPNEFNGIYKGRMVQSSDIMSPFGVRVDQLMRIDEQLCYIYQAPYNRHGVHLMALEVTSNDSIKWEIPRESIEWAKKHGHEHVEEPVQLWEELAYEVPLEQHIANDASSHIINWSLLLVALIACLPFF